MSKNETFSVLTGGGADSLDGILTPSNGDFAFGNISNLFHGYTFLISATGSENSPYLIKADDATTGGWVLGGFQGAMSHVRATTAVGQTIPTATYTTIVFGTEEYDLLSEYDHTTGIFTATYAGYYSVKAATRFEPLSWAVGNFASTAIYKASTLYSSGPICEVEVTRSAQVSSMVTDLIYLAAAGTMKIVSYHDRGSNSDLYGYGTLNYLAINRIA